MSAQPKAVVPSNQNVPATRNPVPKLNPLTRRLMVVTSSDDREFLPAALEILDTPASPKRIAFIWIVCLMLAAALGWSYIAKLDIYAVATGRIQPSGRSKVIQSLDPGKIKTIAVENGMRVKAGDLLLELDPTDAYAERDAAAADLEALDAEIPRRKAEIDAVLNDRSSHQISTDGSFNGRSGMGFDYLYGLAGQTSQWTPDLLRDQTQIFPFVGWNLTTAMPNNATPGTSDIPKVVFPPNVGRRLQTRELNLLGAELAQYRASRDTLKADLGEKTATQTRLRSSIEARERLVALLNQRLSMKSELLAKQAGPLTGVLDAQQQIQQELANLAYDKGQLLETQAAAESTKSKMDQLQKQFIADQSGKLSDAERKRDHQAQDLVKAMAKAERVKLTAPINGTVQQLAVSTIGQVVTTGQPLLVIVPDGGPLEIEALVPNSDIGFLEVGQDAVIKIDAFPFSRYGTVDGKVVRVSRDAVFDKDVSNMDAATAAQAQNASVLDPTPKTQGLVYPVTVQLTQRSILIDGKEVPLSAGMTAAIEVRTGDRRIIDYLLSPLREIVSQSGHER